MARDSIAPVTPRFRAEFVLGLVVSMAAVFVVATPRTTRADDASEARELFQSGASMFQMGNYDGALTEFQASFRLRPAPVVLFNIAQVLKLLFRYDEAIEAYERYLELDRNATADRREAVHDTIRELRRAIAPVTIVVEPADAEVRVDDRPVGRSPLTRPLSLAPGTRRITASRDGYAAETREIEVLSGRALEVRLVLEPESRGTAELVVEAPEGIADARVSIDGDDVGTPPVRRAVSVGGHTVEVRADGFEPFVREIVVAPGQTRTVRPALEVDDGSVTSSWWFWTGVVVVVAGGTAATLWALDASTDEPLSGTLGTVEALRW